MKPTVTSFPVYLLNPTDRMIYDLECTDCSFRRAVEGEHPEVFDVIESHRAERAEFHFDHVVNFEARST